LAYSVLVSGFSRLIHELRPRVRNL
jgi:hypothetical protein